MYNRRTIAISYRTKSLRQRLRYYGYKSIYTYYIDGVRYRHAIGDRGMQGKGVVDGAFMRSNNVFMRH